MFPLLRNETRNIALNAQEGLRCAGLAPCEVHYEGTQFFRKQRKCTMYQSLYQLISQSTNQPTNQSLKEIKVQKVEQLESKVNSCCVHSPPQTATALNVGFLSKRFWHQPVGKHLVHQERHRGYRKLLVLL